MNIFDEYEILSNIEKQKIKELEKGVDLICSLSQMKRQLELEKLWNSRITKQGIYIDEDFIKKWNKHFNKRRRKKWVFLTQSVMHYLELRGVKHQQN